MTASESHFSPALFQFLRQLKKNNNRDWFLANRARYERDVRDPALRFIAAIGPRLRKLSPHLVADPRPVGGSLFRLNRDIRFSSDKSPYKTHIGMAFGHDAGREQPAPGFYLQLDPGTSWAGGGIHMPDTATLGKLRDAIVANPGAWRKVVSDPGFAPMFTNMGEALKRPPQGYPADHPFIEDLKRKSFVWHAQFTEADVVAPGFMDRYLEACRASTPFNRFVAKALDLAW